ncbi:MAG: 50S ribosomal protein L6 [Ruminococcus sp.]|jgi:large subunit ribosomal protein L6|nr:50S ribosomal protein L6 [Ruminococcus sp.]
MSRIGRKPVTVPSGVDIKIEGTTVTVKGPKGTLTQTFNNKLGITNDGSVITVTRPNDEKNYRALHGLTRSLIANMVEGVTTGFSKSLDIEGIGYRAVKQGTDVVLTLGFSHQVKISENADIKLEVPAQNKIIVSGIDKQKVGQYAAEVREKKPPEPYKGKGIRYTGERIIRKEGKAGKGKK